MEIILLKDIPHLGKKYDAKTVRDGYARNFLLPQKLAMFASAAVLNNIEAMRKADDSRRAKLEKEVNSTIAALNGKEIVIAEKANEQGELFGSVSPKIVSEELKKQGFEISEEYINLDEHIKHLGEYDIEIRTGETKAILKLKVERE